MTLTYSLADIASAASRFWEDARHYPVIALSGGLGAGKTTFTRALCAMLGVEDTVSSPTFSLINEYRFRDATGKEQVLFHADCYRLHDEEEAIQAGIEDMLQQANASCIIEWPERIRGVLPVSTLWVDFMLLDEEQRQLSYKI